MTDDNWVTARLIRIERHERVAYMVRTGDGRWQTLSVDGLRPRRWTTVEVATLPDATITAAIDYYGNENLGGGHG